MEVNENQKSLNCFCKDVDTLETINIDGICSSLVGALGKLGACVCADVSDRRPRNRTFPPHVFPVQGTLDSTVSFLL